MEVIDRDGVMTKDLALAIHGKEMQRGHWVVTDVYMDAVNVRFSFYYSSLSVLTCLIFIFVAQTAEEA